MSGEKKLNDNSGELQTKVSFLNRNAQGGSFISAKTVAHRDTHTFLEEASARTMDFDTVKCLTSSNGEGVGVCALQACVCFQERQRQKAGSHVRHQIMSTENKTCDRVE